MDEREMDYLDAKAEEAAELNGEFYGCDPHEDDEVVDPASYDAPEDVFCDGFSDYVMPEMDI
jgi:hypothetical protein